MTPEEFFERYGHLESAVKDPLPQITLKDQLLIAAWECLRQRATAHNEWPRIDPDSITTLLKKLDETEKKLEWTEQKLRMSYEANTDLNEDRFTVRRERDALQQQLTEARRWLLLFATIDGYEIVNVSEDKEQAALRYRITLSVAAHERLEKFVASLREG